jgi:tetratricopeptide (TPR) repeat protein
MATLKKSSDKTKRFVSTLMLFTTDGMEKPDPQLIGSIARIREEFLSEITVKILVSPAHLSTWQVELASSELQALIQSGKCILETCVAQPKENPVDIEGSNGYRYVLLVPGEKLGQHANLNHVFGIKSTVWDEGKSFEIFFNENEKKIRNQGILAIPASRAGYLLPFLYRSEKSGIDFLRYILIKLGEKIDSVVINQPNPFVGKAKKTPLLSRCGFFIEWFLKIPLKELKTTPHLQFPFIRQSSIFRLLFVVLAFILFILIPVMSLNSGISGDEPNFQYPQALKIYNYFVTLGKDKSWEQTEVDMTSYGMSFDVVTVFIIKIFNIDNIYELRHFLNGFTGWIALLFAGLLAVRLGGFRAGLLTLILAFLTPSFMGHVWNNPKDIPFATGYILGLYFIVRFIQELPKPRRSTIILTGLAIASAISVRVGGLLLIAYLGFFTGLYFLFSMGLMKMFRKDNFSVIKRAVVYMFLIAVIGYFAGLILWPFGLENPIKNPIIALGAFTNFATSLRQVFGGKFIWSDNVPWNYIPQYMLITIPVLVLLGFVLFILFIKRMDQKYKYFWAFVLLFSFAFPIFYIIYKKSNVYGGWRHALFTFPPLAVMSALGYEYLLGVWKNKYFKYVVVLLFAGLAFHPLRFTVVNHPFEYIYYNELIGGVDKAYGKYETDYYYHSIREGCNWLRKEIEPRLKAGEKIKVASNFSLSVLYYLRDLKDQVTVVYIRYYDKGDVDWDYAIVANSYMNPSQLKSGKFPPKHTIHTIDVDKIPVCAIIQRTSKADYQGLRMLDQGRYDEGKVLLKKALEDNMDNETALMGIARAYIESYRPDSSLPYLGHLLKVYPDYDKGLNLVGIAYMNMNQLDKALSIFERIVKVNPKFAAAYHNLGLIYMQTGNLNMAMNYFQNSINVNRGYKPSYLALAEVLRRLGRNAESNQVLEFAKQFK